MSNSACARICFGIARSSDAEGPWNDLGLEDWWRNETGYVPPFELFDADGQFLPSVELATRENGWGRDPKDKALVPAYFDAQRQWDAAHPLPVEEVTEGYHDEPSYIYAVPGTLTSVCWGEPLAFDPASLTAPPDALAAFTSFCQKYGVEGEPQWYLSAYWG